MNFFENELRKLFGTGAPFADARFVGRTCVGRLGDTTNVKLEFVTHGTMDKYEGIKATVLNRKEGVIDSNLFLFNDILGKKPMKSSPATLIKPYIWVYQGSAEWYGFTPKKEDYKAIADTVNSYLEVFIEPVQRVRETEKASANKQSVTDAIRSGTKAPRQPGIKTDKPKNKTECEH